MKTSKLITLAIASSLLTAARAGGRARTGFPGNNPAHRIARARKGHGRSGQAAKGDDFLQRHGMAPSSHIVGHKAFEILGRKSGAFEVAAVSEDASNFTRRNSRSSTPSS